MDASKLDATFHFSIDTAPMSIYNRSEMLFEEREISKTAGLVCSSLGGELLIYDSASGNVHVLNQTARQVWNWLDEGIAPAEMASRLCGSYAGITLEAAEQDARQILRTFLQSALITSKTASPPQVVGAAG